jgi:hypothetical protein
MKKIILSLLMVLLFIVNIFAYDWYSYIGKEIVVCIADNCYRGKVLTVSEINLCKRQDIYGNCLEYKVYYSLIMNIGIIPCEKIESIYEIK